VYLGQERLHLGRPGKRPGIGQAGPCGGMPGNLTERIGLVSCRGAHKAPASQPAGRALTRARGCSDTPDPCILQRTLNRNARVIACWGLLSISRGRSASTMVPSSMKRRVSALLRPPRPKPRRSSRCVWLVWNVLTPAGSVSHLRRMKRLTESISSAGDAGGSDGEPIVHSDCLAGFAGHDCDTQS
jgi:hypothetical protein